MGPIAVTMLIIGEKLTDLAPTTYSAQIPFGGHHRGQELIIGIPRGLRVKNCIAAGVKKRRHAASTTGD